MFDKQDLRTLSDSFDDSTCESADSTPKVIHQVPSYDKLVLTEMLNKAKFPVFLGSLPSRKEQFAVKLFPFVAGKPDPCFLNEIRFTNLRHENVISILHYETQKDADFEDCSAQLSYTLMELAPYGDFHDMLTFEQIPSEEKFARTYFHQLIEGLEYLHSNGISHLDLKPDNLLLGEHFILKIADFDQAYMKGQNKIYSRGTECFRAPEIKNSTCRNPEAADIYSAGLLLFILNCRGTLPYFENKKYKGIDLYDLLMTNPASFWEKHSEIQEQTPSFFSEDFKSLFTSMVNFLPEKRLTIEKIKKSKWYNGPIYSQEELSVLMQNILNSIEFF